MVNVLYKPVDASQPGWAHLWHLVRHILRLLSLYLLVQRIIMHLFIHVLVPVLDEIILWRIVPPYRAGFEVVLIWLLHSWNQSGIQPISWPDVFLKIIIILDHHHFFKIILHGVRKVDVRDVHVWRFRIMALVQGRSYWILKGPFRKVVLSYLKMTLAHNGLRSNMVNLGVLGSVFVGNPWAINRII